MLGLIGAVELQLSVVGVVRGGSAFTEVGGGGRSRSLHVPTGFIHGVTCELKLGER